MMILQPPFKNKFHLTLHTTKRFGLFPKGHKKDKKALRISTFDVLFISDF
jgi:hypothetical protein